MLEALLEVVVDFLVGDLLDQGQVRDADLWLFGAIEAGLANAGGLVAVILFATCAFGYSLGEVKQGSEAIAGGEKGLAARTDDRGGRGGKEEVWTKAGLGGRDRNRTDVLDANEGSSPYHCREAGCEPEGARRTALSDSGPIDQRLTVLRLGGSDRSPNQTGPKPAKTKNEAKEYKSNDKDMPKESRMAASLRRSIREGFGRRMQRRYG